MQQFPLQIKQTVLKVDGSTLTKTYKRGKLLGKGGFAYCFQIIDCQSNELFACKFVNKQKIQTHGCIDKLKFEIQLHRKLRHKNVVGFHNAFQDQKFVYIILQLCKNGSLWQLISKRKRLTVTEIRFIISNIIQGFKYLHQNFILHRDLKAGNIFLAQGFVPKIGDFGLSAKLQFRSQKKRTICGTPNYVSPDLLKKVGYSFEVDYWAIGILTYVMFTGQTPFQNIDLQAVYKNIKSANYSFPKLKTFTSNAKDFISKILVINKQLRMNLNQMLAHPFISQEQIVFFLPQDTFDRQTVPRIKFMQNQNQNINNNITKKVIRKTSFNISNCSSVLSSRQGKSGLHNRNRTIQRCRSVCKKVQVDKQVYVYKYIDYEQKFGIGYQLSNGQFGVYFRDNTILAIDQKLDQITIINRNCPQIKQTFSIQKYKLKSKQYIKKYKLYYSLKQRLSLLPNPKINKPLHHIQKNIFLQDYIKVKGALILQLSNQVLNTFFENGTYLIIETCSNRARYFDTHGKQIVSKLQDIDQNSQFYDAYSFTRWTFKQLGKN